MKKVVVMGGGTGTFIVLSGIKKKPYEISAVVSVMDSGGSTGRLRDQFGVLPPGDIRQCLVALSDAPELWRKLFLYRFNNGDFEGHNFGNIFLTALEKTTDTYDEVIKHASYILQTKGSVIPVTLDKVHLCATYEDGETIESEKLIDSAFHKKSKIKKAYLKPNAQAYSKAIEAIDNADYIILGPGDLYTSLIPNLVVDGIRDAFNKTKAKVIIVTNLMTKLGQTTGYTASDHIVDLEKYLGRKVDYILHNNGNLPEDVVKHYQDHGEQIVHDDLSDDKNILRLDLVANIRYNATKGDKIPRSILRHDSAKLAEAIEKILSS